MTRLMHRPTPGYLVWRLSMKLRASVDAAVAPLGLTHAQYSVLASLRGMTEAGHNPSQRELADHTGLDPIYISKLARALAQRGLIERAPDDRDTRAVRLTVTRKGLSVVDRAIAIVADLQEQFAAPLGGLSSRRMQGFMKELELLIAAPLPAPSSRTTHPREKPS